MRVGQLPIMAALNDGRQGPSIAAVNDYLVWMSCFVEVLKRIDLLSI